MIKRRFYKLEHGDRDAPSQSSSSSSGSEIDAASEEEEDEEKQEDQEQENREEHYDYDSKRNSSDEMQMQNLTGYESEDSSANEVILDSSGLPANDDDSGTVTYGETKSRISNFGGGVSDNIQHKTMTESYVPYENSIHILRHKSVFKCRICPRVVLLSEETLIAHLKSKRHARSEKLLREGRLKLMLNQDGRIDGQEEEDSSRKKEKKVRLRKEKKSFKMHGRQGKRSRKEKENYSSTGNARSKNLSKRKQINDD
ncbi:unnamed protein product [Cuscuta epithymum]|uniref:C2H2-type domain-containing protein n=1 Tax=Cuscuta epithymum TaxID=186058 RepID=A0AAV0E2B3_9ASTE|nr:unnamed protein product [Cuscuta epithymum]CAH9142779.1 unnamed protein product [Cuscuta epithymum]